MVTKLYEKQKTGMCKGFNYYDKLFKQIMKMEKSDHIINQPVNNT